MPTNVFTDNKRVSLQLQLQIEYELLAVSGKSAHEIYQILSDRVRYNLNDPHSGLYDLSPADQTRVYILLNTFLKACPLFLESKIDEPEINFVFRSIPMPRNEFYLYSSPCYCPSDNAFFTWLMLDTFRYHSVYHVNPVRSAEYSDYATDGNRNYWAILLLAMLTALTLTLAFWAIYYLFSQFLDDIDRFWNNEGWIQAVVSFMTTAASACAASLLCSFFLSGPLTALAIGAGISSPAGLVILSLSCLSIIGASLGCFVVNKAQEYLIRRVNPDAMDIYDPHRYKLTQDERVNLINKGLDPEKVLTAMVAIRQLIGKEALPSLLHRTFSTEGKRKQALLRKIRELRSGDISESYLRVEMPANPITQATAYSLEFDLRYFPEEQIQPPEQLGGYQSQTCFYDASRAPGFSFLSPTAPLEPPFPVFQ